MTLKDIAQAYSDQAWASLEDYYSDIERIGKFGPSENDTILVRKMAHVIAGDLIMRYQPTPSAFDGV